MGIILWIVFGLVAGVIAKFIMPGKDGTGVFMTIVLGIVGAVIGGFISNALGFGGINGFTLQSMVIAVCGSLLVLFIFHKISR
ncbi:GlsB/YeaQ/YmgE family stress response membrane protein [Klebsiella aerogenes]|uniref:GlsB/YeaQ/YmgE family stress response membrane protein n=1 Tax=Klebsiella aerogenes TaxID=548 RepID=UPI000DA147E5|nr:GlsB/YeaQ/YmgE family stress response membrane protein [Klebsiella aerogenes]HCB2860315.1 GlsB/YeaQ/YmgE family stress response membrane protein [Klebsiella aerogenes]HCB2865489.1 GlsB/YeaQ/YmgE family stress response membrane protein [Klebsiella aerogenes]HCB2881656.1 GlsB/YeaQ/YmgE family stress response membrane protein [Klebsiella aerogenes]HCB3346313.1 GlsB/YeaQ/YmgE family stress response membrane protein [Klebsiella aerogenes]HCM1812383.1 GlsB/YeaQ/YmgE family stress response membran